MDTNPTPYTPDPTTPLSPDEAAHLLAPVDGHLSPLAHRLLIAFLNPTIDLPALATNHRLALDALLSWWRSPEVQRAMADLEALAAQRARLTAAHDAPRMALRLAQLAEDAKPETARRAAVNVLHLAGCTPTAPVRAPRPPAPVPRPDLPTAHATLTPNATAAPRHAKSPLTALQTLNGHARHLRSAAGTPTPLPLTPHRAHPPRHANNPV